MGGVRVGLCHRYHSQSLCLTEKLALPSLGQGLSLLPGPGTLPCQPFAIVCPCSGVGSLPCRPLAKVCPCALGQALCPASCLPRVLCLLTWAAAAFWWNERECVLGSSEAPTL